LPGRPGAAAGDFQTRVRDYEAALLREALAASRFNQRRTADRLGLSYDQLRHYLKKHGISAASPQRQGEAKTPGGAVNGRS
jgi:psp operon transcriptional activator